jgi:peroxiredoxin Q/BCP
VAYFTASCDTVETNTKFAKSLDLDYPILSDPDKKVAEAYGVVTGGQGNPKRWTIYIDKDGVVREIDKAVKAAQAGTDVLEKLKALGIAQ